MSERVTDGAARYHDSFPTAPLSRRTAIQALVGMPFALGRSETLSDAGDYVIVGPTTNISLPAGCRREIVFGEGHQLLSEDCFAWGRRQC